MSDNRVAVAAAEFIGAFNIVFDTDWDYTLYLLGSVNYIRRVFPGEETFLNSSAPPKNINWGARAALLKAHQRLVDALKEEGLAPDPPIPDDSCVYTWPEKTS